MRILTFGIIFVPESIVQLFFFEELQLKSEWKELIQSLDRVISILHKNLGTSRRLENRPKILLPSFEHEISSIVFLI